jgi:hypothetical protein
MRPVLGAETFNHFTHGLMSEQNVGPRTLPPQITFLGIHQDDFQRSSIPSMGTFQYPDPKSAYLTRLRSEYSLDDVVKGAETPFEEACKLNTWVNQQWEHQNGMPKSPDAKSILDEAKEGGKFPCFAYARVLTACLNAMGIPARSVGLKSKDVETRAHSAGHVVTEAYLENLQKWVMFDPTTGGVFTQHNIPLNIAELKEAVEKSPRKVKALTMKEAWNNRLCVQWVLRGFLNQYLYYWDANYDQTHTILGKPDEPGLMYVPPGAKNPTVFQRNSPILNRDYTHSLTDFYKAPPKK